MKANNPLLVGKFLTFNKNANYFSKILPNDFSFTIKVKNCIRKSQRHRIARKKKEARGSKDIIYN